MSAGPSYSGRYLVAWAQAEYGRGNHDLARDFAYRRAGDHDAAIAALSQGLAEGVQDYAGTLPGVLTWDRARRSLGLPVPPGFEEPATTLLGLDPAGSRPATPWTEEPLRVLTNRAAAWCGPLYQPGGTGSGPTKAV